MKKLRRWICAALLVVMAAGCSEYSSGDRVLVAKYFYDPDHKPQRYNVVVFRYPRDPLDSRGSPTNYIKRLLGLAGETLFIFFGQLFHSTDLSYPEDQQDRVGEDGRKIPFNPLNLWRPEYLHESDEKALDLFRTHKFKLGNEEKLGQFKILQKPPEVMLALRRIVYDNDYPAKDLKDLPPRWEPAQSNWKSDSDHGFKHGGAAANEPDWLHYQHILRPLDWPQGAKRKHKPQLITDFSGYNSYELPEVRTPLNGPPITGTNWVGDLMLEFELTVEKAEGELWVELARGVDRFRARWELKTGRCTLSRLSDAKDIAVELEKDKGVIAEAETSVSEPGTYQIRFANFDERLTVWVDRDLPFGDGKSYTRAWHWDKDAKSFVNVGPTAHDLKPASIGSKGASVRLDHLKLWRDTYYTRGGSLGNPATDARLPDVRIPDGADPKERRALDAEHWADFWSKETEWGPLKAIDVKSLYVQPGHYLCLGDNSPESSDSRMWGLVPERLLLGRALVVYYPFDRAGLIH